MLVLVKVMMIVNCLPEVKITGLDTNALWSGTNENKDVSTGPLARPFACSHAPLTHLLALNCSLCLHALLRSFVGSGEMVSDWMSQNDLVLSHSEMVEERRAIL